MITAAVAMSPGPQSKTHPSKYESSCYVITPPIPASNYVPTLRSVPSAYHRSHESGLLVLQFHPCQMCQAARLSARSRFGITGLPTTYKAINISTTLTLPSSQHHLLTFYSTTCPSIAPFLGYICTTTTRLRRQGLFPDWHRISHDNKINLRVLVQQPLAH